MYKIKSIFSIIVLLLMFVSTKAQFSGTGNGTEASPYLIANAIQLDEMRNYVGSENSDKHFSISNDIDLTALIATKYPNEGWEPIGSDENAFYGSLEGNGFKITNLWISRPESNYVGLFSNTTDAVINNLNIQLATNGIVGQDYVGILAGSANGGTINNVKVIGIVTAYNYVGGLIGESSSPVSNCQSSGEINTEGDNIGGLIGKTSAEVSGSNSSSNVKNMGTAFVGNFMGGLIGVNQAAISNSNASGSVTGTSTIGGLVGDSYAPVSNSFATGNISGRMWVGGLVGASDSVSNSYATGTVYSDQKVGGGLVGQSYGTITSSHAFGNVSGSQSIGGLVGILGATVTFSYATGNVTQIIADTTPEGGFVDIGGLAGSSFSNSFIENCFASGDVAVTDNNAMYVGGLVGLSNGISNSYAYGSVSGGYSLVGGLAGTTWGAISNSAALNPKLTSSLTGNLNKIHRIAGDVEFDAELTNNYALDSMLVNGQIITDGTETDWSGMNKSISEAQKQTTYENGLTWDFTNIWKIRENQGYPYLQGSEYLTNIITSNSNNEEWGTISPNGVVALKAGSAKTFELTPKEGYEIESVIVDNENIGKQLTYTFTNIAENHTILAVYKVKQLGTSDINKNDVIVYPNPTADRIFVSGNKKVIALELYNVVGQKVLESYENSLDLTSVAKGNYILKIKTENGEISSSKIIKK